MRIYLNGRLVGPSEAVISVFDRGFLYGDGVYETMRSYEGVIFMLKRHVERLGRSAGTIGLSLPLGAEGIKEALYETLGANSLSDAYLRLTVSRGEGPFGLDPTPCTSPTFVIIARGLPERMPGLYEVGVKAIIPRTRRNPKEALDPGIKSLNFLNNILAKAEAVRLGAYEALMLNVSGSLTEGTASNLFFVKRGSLFTPSQKCGILEGITREVVISLAKGAGLGVMEGEFSKEELCGADEVFVTNSTMEVLPVSEVDGAGFGVGPVTRLLMGEYRKAVRTYVDGARGAAV